MVKAGAFTQVWVGETEVFGRTGGNKPGTVQNIPSNGPTPPPAPTENDNSSSLSFWNRPNVKAIRVGGDKDLVAQLDKAGIIYSGRIEQPGIIETLLSWILPLGIMIAFWFYMMKRMGQAGQGVMAFGKSRVKIHGENDVETGFDDVAGVDEAKEELQEVVTFLMEPQRYARIGARIPKGVLLVGLPGTGKTLLARAVAGEAHVPFFTISGAEFVEMFVGVGAARVRDLFAQAEKNAPCIVFIDELDALGKSRGAGGLTGGNDEREQTLNQLLVQMDGFDTTTGVIILAATNRPEILDPALLRPGRFDRQVLVDKPDRAGRRAILEVHARDVELSEDVDLDEVAARTPGFVGADLANLLNEAALLAARRGADEVTGLDVDRAIDRIVAGLEKKNRLINPTERKIVAHHEMGHAIVGSCVPGADPVQKVTIVPRGMGALGLTWQTPTEDRYLMTKTELEGKIAALLGGRAAELVFFGEASTGAANDLARATDAARAMVVEYGMSDTLGPIRLAPERNAFLQTPADMFLGSRKEYGDKVADTIDQEVRNIVEGQMERAKKIIESHRQDVAKLVSVLLEKETIDGDEVRKICNNRTKESGSKI
ncbi:MAG: ATP-dependent zinc metalloprotease FtsH [Deltaproteobacteria bacterium]|nr:ATP-dependent zinc metalloprotease FtsH [Deltaproteobacteria bacterium]